MLEWFFSVDWALFFTYASYGLALVAGFVGLTLGTIATFKESKRGSWGLFQWFTTLLLLIIGSWGILHTAGVV